MLIIYSTFADMKKTTWKDYLSTHLAFTGNTLEEEIGKAKAGSSTLPLEVRNHLVTIKNINDAASEIMALRKEIGDDAIVMKFSPEHNVVLEAHIGNSSHQTAFIYSSEKHLLEELKQFISTTRHIQNATTKNK